jgi:hypothetical protein
VEWCQLCYSFDLYLPVCWSDGFLFVVLRFSPGLLSIGVYFAVS